MESSKTPPTPPPAAPDPEKDARMWAMICHFASLSGYLVSMPFAGILGPLVVWLVKKDELPQIEAHFKEAINFQISVTLYMLACIPLVFVGVGVILLLALVIFNLVCVIQAALRANNGEQVVYPMSIRFVK